MVCKWLLGSAICLSATSVFYKKYLILCGIGVLKL